MASNAFRFTFVMSARLSSVSLRGLYDFILLEQRAHSPFHFLLFCLFLHHLVIHELGFGDEPMKGLRED